MRSVMTEKITDILVSNEIIIVITADVSGHYFNGYTPSIFNDL